MKIEYQIWHLNYRCIPKTSAIILFRYLLSRPKILDWSRCDIHRQDLGSFHQQVPS